MGTKSLINFTHPSNPANLIKGGVLLLFPCNISLMSIREIYLRKQKDLRETHVKIILSDINS